MHKLRRTHLALLAAIALAMILTGCGGSDSGPCPGPTPSPTDVTGEWMLQSGTQPTVNSQQNGTSGPPAYANIKDDGTYRLEWRHDLWEEGNWDTSDGQITFTITSSSEGTESGNQTTFSYAINNNTLVLTGGSTQYNFVYLADSVPSDLADKWVGTVNNAYGRSVFSINLSADGSYTGTEAAASTETMAITPAQDSGSPNIYWNQGKIMASVEDELLVMPETFGENSPEMSYFPLQYQLGEGNNELQLSAPGASTSQNVPNTMYRKTDMPDALANLWLRVESAMNGTWQPRYSEAWLVFLMQSTGAASINGYESPGGTRLSEDFQTEGFAGNRLALVQDSGSISNVPIEVVNTVLSGDNTLALTSTDAEGDTYVQTFKASIDQPSNSVGTWNVTDVSTSGVGSSQTPDITITIHTDGTYRHEEGPAPVEWEEGDLQFFADGYFATIPTDASYQDMSRQWMAYNISGDTMTITTWEEEGGSHVTRTMTLQKQ